MQTAFDGAAERDVRRRGRIADSGASAAIVDPDAH
jgi:hypothetical protein